MQFLAPTKPVKRSIESEAMEKRKEKRKKIGEEKKEKKEREKERRGEGKGKKRRKWTDASLPVEPSWQRTN